MKSLEEKTDAYPALELVNVLDRFKSVRAFVFDVDGVLTDNSILVTENGELLRTMNIRDGQAIKWAIRAGFPVAVITGGSSQGVVKRLAGLGIEQIYTGIHDKWPVLQQILQQSGLKAAEVCYMGDDMPDLPILRRVGLPACPADAVPEVKDSSAFIATQKGGHGCVREVIEKVLKLREKWPEY